MDSVIHLFNKRGQEGEEGAKKSEQEKEEGGGGGGVGRKGEISLPAEVSFRILGKSFRMKKPTSLFLSSFHFS